MDTTEQFAKKISTIKKREDLVKKFQDSGFIETLSLLDTMINLPESTLKKLFVPHIEAFVLLLPFSAGFLKHIIELSDDSKRIKSLYERAIEESLNVLYEGIGPNEISSTMLNQIEIFKEDVAKYSVENNKKKAEYETLKRDHAKLSDENASLEKLIKDKQKIIEELKASVKGYREANGTFLFYKDELESYDGIGGQEKRKKVLDDVEKLLKSIHQDMQHQSDLIEKISKS